MQPASGTLKATRICGTIYLNDDATCKVEGDVPTCGLNHSDGTHQAIPDSSARVGAGRALPLLRVTRRRWWSTEAGCCLLLSSAAPVTRVRSAQGH